MIDEATVNDEATVSDQATVNNLAATGIGEVAVGEPDLVRVQREPDGTWGTGTVALRPDGPGLRVEVGGGRVSRVHLRWRQAAPAGLRVLGDAWERTYGDLGWRGLDPSRLLPWTVLGHSADRTWGLGVEVRAGAFAGWTVDAGGVSLWLDLRAGDHAVELGDRVVTAATVRRVTGPPDAAFAVQKALASVLCRDPLPAGPLVGCNNWYYAYGRDFDANAVVRDARQLAELVGDHPVRPFGVIDDGWTPNGTADGFPGSGGPWNAGRPGTFPDMAGVAADIAAEGVRPGIWFRPLLAGQKALDPSDPATLSTVSDDVRTLRGWGFDLIKHDFSTFDAFGRWGFQMGANPAAGNPYDRSRTSAEVLVDFYRAIRDAAGDGIVLGCNVVGHLAAGLVEAQRTGDDTSGLDWERTRRMGVNTLAFRLAQHGRFFAVDADCVPSTTVTDWALNRRFLDLIARSGTALFVSVDPRSRTAAVDDDLSRALRLALSGGDPGGVEPLDWFDTTAPGTWRSGSDVLHYEWLSPTGADPFSG